MQDKFLRFDENEHTEGLSEWSRGGEGFEVPGDSEEVLGMVSCSYCGEWFDPTEVENVFENDGCCDVCGWCQQEDLEEENSDLS